MSQPELKKVTPTLATLDAFSLDCIRAIVKEELASLARPPVFAPMSPEQLQDIDMRIRTMNFEKIVPMLRNSDGTPYQAGYEDRKGAKLQELVMIALGQASTCWSHIEAAGVFDDSKAIQIGDELVKQIKDLMNS